MSIHHNILQAENSVNSALSEGFYNDGLYENMF